MFCWAVAEQSKTRRLNARKLFLQRQANICDFEHRIFGYEKAFVAGGGVAARDLVW